MTPDRRHALAADARAGHAVRVQPAEMLEMLDAAAMTEASLARTGELCAELATLRLGYGRAFADLATVRAERDELSDELDEATERRRAAEARAETATGLLREMRDNARGLPRDGRWGLLRDVDAFLATPRAPAHRPGCETLIASAFPKECTCDVGIAAPHALPLPVDPEADARMAVYKRTLVRRPEREWSTAAATKPAPFRVGDRVVAAAPVPPHGLKAGATYTVEDVLSDGYLIVGGCAWWSARFRHAVPCPCAAQDFAVAHPECPKCGGTGAL